MTAPQILAFVKALTKIVPVANVRVELIVQDQSTVGILD
jgi:hypothetical protein